MADENTGTLPKDTGTLPEGTDTVIIGGSTTETPTPGDTEVASDADELAPTTGAAQHGSLSERLRDGRGRIGNQAGEKARGLVTQGLERTAEALANVSRMVGDTADGIEERLGAEYGDYARRAAGSIESAANSLASKDPDELIEDTRNFVRNSPGIALAGAAVVGFVVARLVKSGLGADDGTDNEA
ncbi:hypothetical protein H9L13_07645 [Sphingomonas lutea]|uniref:CsbD family protein n=1 Tax=Sphingomonas lutea TaxID=1045317 RepID=A0A7G9SFG1_9SPHN|nr:hypothetical protein [Sphingomonas lutea]QNN66586.1 hypothetical protein H9L13_07645 [Sphingomonas lutea]